MMDARSTIVFLFVALAAGCVSRGRSDGTDGAKAPAPPVVDGARKDLVLSWFADGGPHVASSVAEVPAEARKEVRVQDPSVPPEKRDPRWIFLADLTAPGKDGRYPVRAEPRDAYEVRHRPPPATSASAASGPVASGNPTGADVVMYATRTCPVCQKARRWLLDQGIPYVERDLDADPKALGELAEKGRAQGVPTSGVQVFEIRGRLLPGFDPAAIVKQLGPQSPSRTI
ncbi:MAG: glutaredoxin family protein [Deltaproteobacteria bacterium]|nr:glutaredoxin family protein [Deltaproteobacteria bacterium]